MHFSIRLSSLFLALLLVCSLTGCENAGGRRTARPVFQPSQGGPAVLAIYQPWFGDPEHIKVGYSSQDRGVVERQVEQARSLGIESFVVDWYGPQKSFMDRAYAQMQDVAAEKGFHVALLYDETSDGERATETTVSDLQYAYQHYIGPQAAQSRSAYLTYDGRPVIFIFPKSHKTDWARVRRDLSGWEQPPILIYEYGENVKADPFDGLYAWVNPGHGGWSRDGSHWGQDYLESFYSRMTSEYPDKIAVGAAWPQFDDTKANWSQNRHISARCGKTFADTLRAFRRYYNDRNPLPFMLVETWNDYEEGTAIEPGVNTCLAGTNVASAAAQGTQ